MPPWAAMQSWGCDFGYELVDDDWKLAYQPPDPQLTSVIRDVVSSARVQQARLIAAAPREYESHRKATYRAGGRGGVAREGGGDDDATAGYQVADVTGPIASGYGSEAWGGGAGSGNGTVGSGNGVSGSGTGGYGPGGETAAAEREVSVRRLRLRGSGSGTGRGALGPGGGNGNGGTGYGNGSGGTGSGGTGNGDMGRVAEQAAAAAACRSTGHRQWNSRRRMGSGGWKRRKWWEWWWRNGKRRIWTGRANGGSGTGDGSVPVAGSQRYAGNGAGNGPSLGYPQNAGGNANGGNANNGNAPTPTNGTANAGTNPNTNPNPSNANPNANANSRANPNVNPNSDPNAVSNSDPNGASSYNPRPEGYVDGRPPSEPPEEPRRRGENSDADSQNPPSPTWALRPGEWEPTPEQPRERPDDKPKDDDAQKKRERKPRSLADAAAPIGACTIRRETPSVLRGPIRVQCYPDRLVVFSDRSPTFNKTVPLGPRTESSVDMLVGAVWDQVGSLGDRRPGQYWRPVLNISVAPGAEQRFADLRRLLDGSGLKIVKK